MGFEIYATSTPAKLISMAKLPVHLSIIHLYANLIINELRKRMRLGYRITWLSFFSSTLICQCIYTRNFSSS